MTTTSIKTDREIHQAVLKELQWNTQVDETDVGVEVDHGIVTLTGTVNSYAKKIAAQEAAHCVADVLDVANDIQVHTPDNAAHTDTEIARAVRHALEWDALIAQEKIRSTVSNGYVTLEGNVPSLTDQRNAERTVHNLIGVQGVTNKLTIHTPKIAQEEVRSSIVQALERRVDREAERIQVTVKDGTVFLVGKVHNWNEKQAVLGAAGCAPGVQKVEDCLRVDPYF